MKKLYLLLFTFLASCMLSFAENTVGHFFVDLSDKNVAAVLAVQYLQDNFSVDNLSEFKLERDYTDDLGIHHTNYKQYYAGVEVEDALIMVHSKDGVITSINGCILETAVSPDATIAQLRQKNANGGELMVVSKPTPNGTEYVLAYKVFDASQMADVYIDAETGEVVKVVPQLHNVSATAVTLYDGVQYCDVTYSASSDMYLLRDEDRDIVTMYAKNSAPSVIDEFMDSVTNRLIVFPTEEVAIDKMNDAFVRYTRTCNNYVFDNTICSYSKISTLTISSFPNTDWYSTYWLVSPKFYVQIVSSDGNELYKSSTFTEADLPYTMNLKSKNIVVQKGCKIKVYEYWSGDLGVNVNMSSHTQWSGKWTHTNVNGSFTLEGTQTEIGSPAIQAHWAMKETYDFYKEIFGRRSYDNKGGTIYQFIDPKQEGIFEGGDLPNNAYASYIIKHPDSLVVWAFIAYGLGDGTDYNPFVSLDISAHEFTHNVTKCNGNGGLTYQGESGALNESFSDIMGFSVENYVLGDDDYLIGEDIMINVSNMRSMKDPKQTKDGKTPYPDTYGGKYWVDPNSSTDYGGVHANSGVQNKWFYLLSEGGSGTNDKGNSYLVKGIGIEKAQQIAYRNLTTYQIPASSFFIARVGSMMAATDLYGKNSAEYQSVMNAWYAVGVGSAYDPSAIEEEEAEQENIAVYSTSGNIYVEAQEPVNISVYTTDGSPLYYAEQTQEAEFSVPSKGIYIVKAGSKNIKVEVQ